MNKYKLGICSWCLPEKGLYESLELLHQLGLDSMELDIDFDENNPLLCPNFCKKYLQKANEYGISFNSTALNAIGDCLKNGTVDKFIDMAIKIAVNMNLKILQVPAFFETSLEKLENFENSVLLYQKICDKISSYNIVLGSENTLSYEKNLELLKRVNRDNFKIYYDTQNQHNLHSFDMALIYTKLQDNICEIHLKDGYKDFGNKLLATGSAEFEKTVTAIKNSPYQGYLHIETFYSLITENKEEQIKLLKEDIKTVKNLFLSQNF